MSNTTTRKKEICSEDTKKNSIDSTRTLANQPIKRSLLSHAEAVQEAIKRTG